MKRKGLIFLVLAVLVLGGVAWFNAAPLKRLAYAGAGRDNWQQPARVVEALALRPGDRVADIGAGGGYFTFRFAEAVGRDGKVFAIDVDPDMTRNISAEAAKRGLANIEAILAKPDSPGLAAESVDMIFLANTYHHLSNRTEYFRAVLPALRAGGRIVVVEFRQSGWLGKMVGHSSTEEDMQAEMKEAGYRLAARHTFLKRQHFLVFEKQ